MFHSEHCSHITSCSLSLKARQLPPGWLLIQLPAAANMFFLLQPLCCCRGAAVLAAAALSAASAAMLAAALSPGDSSCGGSTHGCCWPQSGSTACSLPYCVFCSKVKQTCTNHLAAAAAFSAPQAPGWAASSANLCRSSRSIQNSAGSTRRALLLSVATTRPATSTASGVSSQTFAAAAPEPCCPIVMCAAAGFIPLKADSTCSRRSRFSDCRLSCCCRTSSLSVRLLPPCAFLKSLSSSVWHLIVHGLRELYPQSIGGRRPLGPLP